MSYERNDRAYGQRGGGFDRGGFDRGAYDRDRHDGGERGFFERAGDEVRSWFGDEDAERRRRSDERYDDRSDRGYGYGGQYGYGERGAPRSEPGGYRSYPRSNRDDGYRRGEYSGGRPYAERYEQADEGRQFDDTPAGGYPYGGGGGFGSGRDPNRERAYRAAYAQRDQGSAPRDQGRQSLDDGHHDYRSWRDRQVESFDRDYDEYRRENRSRFENEFATWRQGRQTQRDSLTRVAEHQEVVGSDGAHVGTVDHVRGDHILLTKTDRDADGHHHSIPSSWIGAVSDKVTLSRTADEAKRAWRDAEEQGGGGRGGGGLNRSFPGTY